MNLQLLQQQIDSLWQDSILPTLLDYIRIPAKSPSFDRDWKHNGYLDEAIALTEHWCKEQPLLGLQSEILHLEDRTPLLLIEVPAFAQRGAENTIVFYGHVDKQPEMTGWDEGLGPWKPLVRDGKLYGRGGADDGYAAFASLAALVALQKQNIPHPRCLVLIEACEESGSYDLPPYMDLLRQRIGRPDLVIGLDSGCGNYDQLWSTTSLRGVVNGVLRVEVLTEGVHSGDASGIVPSSFRLMRQLLDRLEDPLTGKILPEVFHAEIPDRHRGYAISMAETLGNEIEQRYPFVEGVEAMHVDSVELALNRSWRPALSVTGAGGMPPVEDAGNVLRPFTQVKLSLRLPPPIDGDYAAGQLKELLESDPPSNARISFVLDQVNTGWQAPEFRPWLTDSLERASQAFYSAPARYLGEGVTIPFMSMLGEQYPDAQILIVGVLGPGSNAHGSNEFLHLSMVQKLTACLASVVADVSEREAD